MLEGRTYVPLLHLRLAEVRALAELPDAVKNSIFPVIRIRPWLNSNTLARSFEKVADAFGDRFYGLDLDPSPFVGIRETDSHQEFRALLDPAEGFERYFECVREQQFAVPVLRTEQNTFPHLERQVQRAAGLDRGVVIRVQAESPAPSVEALQFCDELGLEQRVTVIDGGWARDLLTRAAICTRLAQDVVAYDPDAEVVIAGSSFPNEFAKKGAHFTIEAYERPLFNEVRRHLNAGQIIFGDWASTRPPAEAVPMTLIPRIDVSNPTEWESWRKVDSESYRDLALRAVQRLGLDETPDLWGNYMIVATANGAEPSIKSAAMAAAVRINLHMTVQATFDAPGALQIADEPVGDDL